MFFHLGLFEIFVSSWLKHNVINSDHIIWLLTLHNLPSLAAAKNNYVLLTVHDHRCVIRPLLTEKKDVFELRWCNNCFELHNIILKASLSNVFVMKANNLTSKYGIPPSRPALSSTICTRSWSIPHRTPQGCCWSQRGSDLFSRQSDYLVPDPR